MWSLPVALCVLLNHCRTLLKVAYLLGPLVQASMPLCEKAELILPKAGAQCMKCATYLSCLTMGYGDGGMRLTVHWQVSLIGHIHHTAVHACRSEMSVVRASWSSQQQQQMQPRPFDGLHTSTSYYGYEPHGAWGIIDVLGGIELKPENPSSDAE